MNKDQTEQLLEVERCFLRLMESSQDPVALQRIGSILSSLYGTAITVTTVPVGSRQEMFVMSVYPEHSTMEKIISSIVDGKDSKVIEKLWEQNKNWTIEIDERILGKNPQFTERELTAMILHEVGHVTQSNKVTSRILNILRYEVAKASIMTKTTMKNKIFTGVMSLPILSACVANNKDGNIKEEIKADKFVKKVGYQQFLITALQKLSKMKTFKGVNVAVANATKDSIDMVQQFNRRKDELLRNKLTTFIGESVSPYMKECVEDSFNQIFGDYTFESDNPTRMPKLEYLHEQVDEAALRALLAQNDITDISFYEERPDFFKKKLKRIDPATIDYAVVLSGNIKSADDKMLCISYARHKLDIINYYLALYKSDKAMGKYIIPNPEAELLGFKTRLEKTIDQVLKLNLNKPDPFILVQWPKNYEG